MLRHWQSRSSQTYFGQPARRGGDYRPPLAWDGLQKVQGSGERRYIRDVLDFAAFDFAIFRFVITVGKKLADCGHARSAMAFVHDFGWFKAVGVGPTCPHARDGRSGIDENAIHVEEHGTALN